MSSPASLESTYYSEVMSTVSDLAPEANKVLAWREDQFLRLGFVEYVAAFLSATKIDLTKMRDLIAAGCPNDLAAQILMGTDSFGEDMNWLWTDENLAEIVALAEAEHAAEIKEVEVVA